MALNISAPGFGITLPQPYTLLQLTNFLKQGFSNCGFPTPTAESLSNPAAHFVVYDFNFNPAKTYAKARFVLETSGTAPTFGVRTRLHDPANYNATTFVATVNTGANNITGSASSVSNTNPLTAYCIPTSEEIFGVLLIEGTTIDNFMGMARPATIFDWYNENEFMMTRLIQIINGSAYWTPYPNPAGVTGSTAIVSRIGFDTFSTRNPVDGKAQVIKAPFLSDYAWAMSGKFSNDIAVTNSTGFFPGDILEVSPTERYWLATPGANGLAYRIA